MAILGVGSYVPERVMTNDELATLVETSDEWIAQRTGIRERRIAADTSQPPTSALAAARAALAAPASRPAEIDSIVAATASPDYYFPATASLIGDQIGAGDVAGYDLSAACTGFVYALAQAYGQLASGLADTVLVVGSRGLLAAARLERPLDLRAVRRRRRRRRAGPATARTRACSASSWAPTAAAPACSRCPPPATARSRRPAVRADERPARSTSSPPG